MKVEYAIFAFAAGFVVGWVSGTRAEAATKRVTADEPDADESLQHVQQAIDDLG